MSIRLGPVCGPACGPAAESRLWAVRKNLGGTDGFGQLGTGMAKGGQCIWSWPGQVPGRETLQWMGLPETGPPAEHMYMRNYLTLKVRGDYPQRLQHQEVSRGRKSCNSSLIRRAVP